MNTLFQMKSEITETYEKYVNTIYRVCFSFMKNTADTEDMVQDTFIKFIKHSKPFNSEQHKKAWLIVTASNLCKDALKKARRTNESIDDYTPSHIDKCDENLILKSVLDLSPKYKTVVYLYYYEGYSIPEIAKMLKVRTSTIKSQLSRARTQLKSMLGDDIQL